jgi:hypothetical protein
MAFTLPKQAQADLSFSLPSHPPQASLTSTFSTRLKASLDQLSQLEGAALCRRRLKVAFNVEIPFQAIETPRLYGAC